MKRKIAFTASAFVLMLGTAHAQQQLSFKPIKEVPLFFIKTTGKLSDLPNLPETHICKSPPVIDFITSKI